MKKNYLKISLTLLCALILGIFANNIYAQGTAKRTFGTVGYQEFEIPAGVSSVTIECYGAGGAGGRLDRGGNLNLLGSGGGGGGAYARSIITVTPGDILGITVGKGGTATAAGAIAHGTDSYVSIGSSTNIVCKAAGGKTVTGNNNCDGAQGGAIADCIGNDLIHSGGNGGHGEGGEDAHRCHHDGAVGGAGASSGGGGGAGGPDRNGGNGSNGLQSFWSGPWYNRVHTEGHRGDGGASGGGYAGSGGNGYHSISVNVGEEGDGGGTYGGGGGGSVATSALDRPGGSGANGYVVITYVASECADDPGVIATSIWTCSSTDTVMTLTSVTDGSGATNPYQYYWEYSTDNGNSWTPISSTNNSTYQASVTGSFRRAYKEDGCDVTYSNVITLTRPNREQAGMVSYAGKMDTTVCSGKTLTLALNGNPSYALSWQYSTNNGGDWYDFTPPFNQAINSNYLVRYLAEISTTCNIASSNNYVINQVTLPEVTAINAPTDLCPGQTSYNVSASITPGTGSITEYNWVGATGANANAIVTATVPNCNIPYNYSLKVKDEFGCESNEMTGTFTTLSPAVTFATVPEQTATNTGSGYIVPTSLLGALSSAVSTTPSCGGNPIVSYTCSPTEGSPVAEGSTTNVVANVIDFCGKSHTVVIPVKAGGSGSTGECPLIITANYITVCEGSSATLTASASGTGATGTPTYTWTPNISTSNTATTPATAAAGTQSYKCEVSFTSGCTASYTIDITTIAKPAETNQTSEICTGESYTYGTSGVAYTWTVTDADGTDATAETTPQSEFNVTVNNTGDASANVVYSVTPHKVVGTTDCDGTPFTVTLTVKPSIANATFNFSASDIVKTLWYGKCDTLVINDLPTYSTSITEYDGLLTVSVSPGIINSDNKLEIRLPAGEHTITWTFTDPCGNSVVKTQNVTINYPECTGTVSDGSGNSYEVVRVGCECWTKTNLKAQKYVGGGDIASAEGYYSTEYPNTSDNIDKFGRLYTWYSAVNVTEGDDNATPTLTTDPTSHIQYVQGICPQGWAIPSQESFQSAFTAAGGTENMKTSDGSLWLPGGAGTNTSGFSAVGAGYYDSNIDRYVNLLGETYWWDDEAVTISEAACSSITHTCPYLLTTKMNKHFGLSVRCVRREN